jgi:putative DNA primase/helicase
VDLDEAQRFLDLLDPEAESWTIQTFDDSGHNKGLAQILHGTLEECATELKKKSRYGAGIFVCPQRTDLKGRKRENVTAIRVVSVDLDSSPLEPVQQCELPPHVIVETSPARYQAHWCAKDISLDEFEGIVCGIAKRFGGDYSIAEVHHCCRLPGFGHAKNPANRFQVRIVAARERAPYTADEIRKAFPPAARPAIFTVPDEIATSSNPLSRPTPKTTGGAPAPVFMSPAAKQGQAEAKAKADKYIGRDGGPPKLLPSVESKLDELADLHPFKYEAERKEAAEDLGVRVGELDKEIERRREDRAIAPFFEEEEPWPESVEGGELLADLCGTFARYVDMSRSQTLACSLWAMLTHVHDFWVSPLLGITSPAPECGKTTLLSVLLGTTALAAPGSNFTGPVIYRVVDLYHPTLLIDEADTFLDDRELRGIVDCGHNRATAYIWRCDGESNEPRRFSVWAPKAISGIGKRAATLTSRSIPIALKRKAPDSKVERAPRDPKAAFETLRRKCTRWGADSFDALSKAEPELPDGLGPRAADHWEPLFAIADLCGPDWGKKARAAALKLSASATHVEQSQTLALTLLKDIRDLFEEIEPETTPKTGKPYKEIASVQLAAILAEREDRPWGEYGKLKKPITPRGIAALLEVFPIRPKETPSGAMGYVEKQFAHLFRRYLSSDHQKNAETQQVAGEFIFGTAKPKSGHKIARKGLEISQNPKI